MILTLTRRWCSGDCTIGTLTVDGAPECFTLEDVVRTSADPVKAAEEIQVVKVAGHTAIPAGTYRVTLHDSPRFGRVPLLHGVPGFTDILIHAGNTAKNTQGCILVGQRRGPASLEQSRLALAALLPKIESADVVTIEIRHAVGVEG